MIMNFSIKFSFNGNSQFLWRWWAVRSINGFFSFGYGPVAIYVTWGRPYQ